MVALVQRPRGPLGHSASYAHLPWPSDVTDAQKLAWLDQFERGDIGAPQKSPPAPKKAIKQRVEELETTVAALAILAAAAMGAAIGDDTVPLIRALAEKSPDLADDVRKVLRRIADAAEGKAT
ncbi:hypothetical protein LMG7053_04890 [Achromobacter ruhlandii]|uniref:Uncharacterized protein n=1 Tax=Achromobacter ruhlandii TaxID=72557 RepID=A0ABM8M1T1_9BURK|nr:hypothetical protein [Achromobacter ruhlandii]CAB3956083.1 hypothetical protein LMG7053_04890 [Achromobacter ruhlandii]